MKKYRGVERVQIEDIVWGMLEETKIIVWIGSSKYWTRVFLYKKDNRLYVRTEYGKYELLDTLNIRKVGAVSLCG